jgi:hypothetical protein
MSTVKHAELESSEYLEIGLEPGGSTKRKSQPDSTIILDPNLIEEIKSARLQRYPDIYIDEWAQQFEMPSELYAAFEDGHQGLPLFVVTEICELLEIPWNHQ